MSVLDPRELKASPLADLHTLAGELGLEGYRRLRKEDLIKQIVEAQGGTVEDDAPDHAEDAAVEPEPVAVADESDDGEEEEPEVSPQVEEVADDVDDSGEDDDEGDDEPAASASEDEDEEEDVRGGILDVLPNGSGFLRSEPYRQSREDVYVSPAQIRRCELRPGDEVSGPARPPRRNERHPSLVRVATINGVDADAPAERSRFESLTAAWPSERLAGPNALAATPFGKGSRVAIGGPPGAGATYLLREAVKVLRERHSDLEVIVVLAGARPEEIAEWGEAGIEVAGGSFDGSFDEQAQVADLAVQRAKRSAEAGRDAVVVVDSLDALPPAAARRVFGAGRNAADAGSLTVLAATGSAAEAHRMATTHVVLEPRDGGDVKVGAGSGTLRAELLS